MFKYTYTYIERELQDTGQLLGKTVIALSGIWTHVPLITSRVWWPLHYQDNHAGNMADWSLNVWHLRHLCPEMHTMTKMADLAKELHDWQSWQN